MSDVTQTDAQVAVAAAERGAEVVLQHYGTQLDRHAKSPTDFATDADLEAERAILDVLRGQRPHDRVLGEEYGVAGAAEAERTWLVDPLCGTLNFAARTPLFSVNVALQDVTGTTVAAVAEPLAGEVTWTDGDAVRVRRDDLDAHAVPSATSRLVDVNVDAPPDVGIVGPQLLGDTEFRSSFGPRVSSTTLALTWVATGRRAAYVTDGTLRPDSVHFTAGLALCAAAGCIVTDLRGQPLHTGPGMVAAADEETHARLLDILGRHLT